MTFGPVFNPHLRIIAPAAKQDAIDLSLTYHLSGANGADTYFQAFLDRISEYRVQDRWRLVHQSSTEGIRSPSSGVNDVVIFNLPERGPIPGVGTLTISANGRGSGGTAPRVLFTGALNARLTGEDRRRIRFDLAINPTRFVRYQPYVARVGEPPSTWELAPPWMIRGRNQRSAFGEITLDGNDNVLLTDRQRSFARPDAWPLHLDRYLTTTFAMIDAMVRQSAGYCGLRIDHPVEIWLHNVETYWEFGHADPVGLVEMLQPSLARLGGRFTSRQFPYGLNSSEQTGTTRSATVLVRSGLALKVYAKSNRRIRIEVVHDLRDSARAIGGRRSTGDRQSLVQWLEALAEDAAAHVNSLLMECRSDLTEEAPGRPGFALAYAIARATSDASVGEALLMLLVWNDAISLDHHDPFRPVVLALEEAGVLSRVRARRPTFALVSEYRPAARQLRGSIPRPEAEATNSRYRLQTYRQRTR